MSESKSLQIRNSTIDFLTFTRQSGEDGVEVRVQDNDVWLTQASIAKLFGVERSVITRHLKVNSQAAVEFRQWATRVLDTFAKQGYTLRFLRGNSA